MSSRDKLQATRANPEGLSPVQLLLTAIDYWGPANTSSLENAVAGALDRAYEAGVAEGIRRGVSLVSGPVRKAVDAALVTAAKNQDGLTKDQPTWATVVQSDS